jgi:GTP-binding protein HflX
MHSSRSHSTHETPPAALLFAVHMPDQQEREVTASLLELAHLLKGLGATVRGQLVQRLQQPPGPKVLGSGKLDELKGLIEAEQSSAGSDAKVLVVFDGELSPSQQRNLAREFKVEVLDRTQVILRIFARRARTRTAQLEIESAELQYEGPRLRDDEALGDKQEGGGGRASKGASSVELRKQQIRKRLADLRQEIEKAQRSDNARRERRHDVAGIALVGYTNAGKSSWMRALTASQVLVQDALFATLDTTVRQLDPPTRPPIVVADTVGFLRNLPNHLLASFRSTLSEALDADLLVIVIDGSDPQWKAHLATTREVLQKVDAQQLSTLYLVNKLDKMSPEDQQAVQDELPDALFVSARSPDDVTRVHQAVVKFFHNQMSEVELFVPYSHAALRAEICAEASVLAETFDEEGGRLRFRADQTSIERWKSVLVGG